MEHCSQDSLTGPTLNKFLYKVDYVSYSLLFSFLIYLSGVEGQDQEALDGNLSTDPSSSTVIYSTATVGSTSISLDQKIHNSPQEGDTEADECASVSKDESSLAQVSSMELSNRADVESSSSISQNHSLVLDDTSSCSDRESDNVLVAEDKDANDVDEDSFLTYDHYTSQDLNLTKYVDIDTESLSGFTSENTMASAENFQNQLIGDTAENHSGSADDSLVESDDKDWMLGLASSMSSIEEKTTRFIQNGYLDTVDGMFHFI